MRKSKSVTISVSNKRIRLVSYEKGLETLLLKIKNRASNRIIRMQ